MADHENGGEGGDEIFERQDGEMESDFSDDIDMTGEQMKPSITQSDNEDEDVVGEMIPSPTAVNQDRDQDFDQNQSQDFDRDQEGDEEHVHELKYQDDDDRVEEKM